MAPLFCTLRASVKRDYSTISSWNREGLLSYDQDMNTKREVGRRIKAARTRLGLSLQEVCDSVSALGGNPSKLGNYEAGRRMPDLDMLKAIAKVLKTDAAWLATLVESEPDHRESLLAEYYRGSDDRGKDSILRTAEVQSRYKNVSDDEPSSAMCG